MQVEYELVVASLLQHRGQLIIARAHDACFRPRRHTGHLRVEETGEVGDVITNELSVRAVQSSFVDGGVVDPQLDPLPEQALGELHKWALPKVIGARLEGKSKKANTRRSAVEHGPAGPVDLPLVRFEHVFEHRHRDIGVTSEVKQCSKILRKTRATEGESWTEIRARGACKKRIGSCYQLNKFQQTGLPLFTKM